MHVSYQHGSEKWRGGQFIVAEFIPLPCTISGGPRESGPTLGFSPRVTFARISTKLKDSETFRRIT